MSTTDLYTNIFTEEIKKLNELYEKKKKYIIKFNALIKI